MQQPPIENRMQFIGGSFSVRSVNERTEAIIKIRSVTGVLHTGSAW